MPIEKKILRPVEGRPGSPDFIFWCPGCKCGHGVWTTKRNDLGATWSFNGDLVRPTFEPSLLIQYKHASPPVTPENLDEWKKKPWPQTDVTNVCHSFVRNGQIEFLGDCTHELRGKTVPMEAF